jgi:hypothetical protein
MKSRFLNIIRPALLSVVWITLVVAACSKRETALYSQELAPCRIVVNQLGFYPYSQKIAIVQGAVRHEDTLRFGNIAEVVDTVRKRVVLRVAMSAPMRHG